MDAVAQLHGVWKRYGRIEALRGIQLVVYPGEVLALLGPNGAGKTTAMEILLGLRRPDRGEVYLFGRSPHDARAREKVGFMPQQVGLPETLRVRELVEMVRSHYPAAPSLDSTLCRFHLDGLSHRLAGGLSQGQRRLVTVALAFAGAPLAVCLDEPTTGLDVHLRRMVWQAIRSHAQGGGTVFLTTHYLDEVEELASRVILLNEGRVIAERSPSEIRSRVPMSCVRFRLRSQALPDGLPGVIRVESSGDAVTLWCEDADRLVRALVLRDIPFEGLTVGAARLEEAFLLLTGGMRREAGVGARLGRTESDHP